MDTKLIGKHLQNRRKKLDITQLQLADMLGVTHQAVSRWETGESIPDIQMLDELAKLYNITIDHIINPTQDVVQSPVPELKETSNSKYEMLFSINIVLNILAFVFMLLTLIRLDTGRIIFLIIGVLLMSAGYVLNIIGYSNSKKTKEDRKRNIISITMLSGIVWFLHVFFVVVYLIQILALIPVYVAYFMVVYKLAKAYFLGWNIKYVFNNIDVIIIALSFMGLMLIINFYYEFGIYLDYVVEFGFNDVLVRDWYYNYDPYHIFMLGGFILFITAVTFRVYFRNSFYKAHIILSSLFLLLMYVIDRTMMIHDIVVNPKIEDKFVISLLVNLIFLMMIASTIIITVYLKRKGNIGNNEVAYSIIFISFIAIVLVSWIEFSPTRFIEYNGGIHTGHQYFYQFNNANFYWCYLAALLPTVSSVILLKHRHNELSKNKKEFTLL